MAYIQPDSVIEFFGPVNLSPDHADSLYFASTAEKKCIKGHFRKTWERLVKAMKDIDSMPLKCHDCPYWEICEEPYVCPTQYKEEET